MTLNKLSNEVQSVKGFAQDSQQQGQDRHIDTYPPSLMCLPFSRLLCLRPVLKVALLFKTKDKSRACVLARQTLYN